MNPFRPRILAAALACALPAFGEDKDEQLVRAEAGDPRAQVLLGYDFRDAAHGRKKNMAEALRWFGRAAAQGDAEGLDNLGWLVEHGMGTPRDPVQARRLYASAADLDHAQAQRNLARCLRDGIGGERDFEGALKWNLAAYRKDPSPASTLGLVASLALQPSLEPHRPLLAELETRPHGDMLLRLAALHEEGAGGLPADPEKAGLLVERAQQTLIARDILPPAQVRALAGKPDVPGAFAYLPTRHIDQAYNMCAPASAAMALAYITGEPADPFAIKKHSIGSETVGLGTHWDHMLAGIRTVTGQEWTFRSFPVDDDGFARGLALLKSEADAGRLALIDLGPHTVVFAGYDEAERVVYIQNPAQPAPGVHTVAYDQLLKRWQSPNHVSTRQGKPARPVLLTRPEPPSAGPGASPSD